jgi:hypothetical protein
VVTPRAFARAYRSVTFANCRPLSQFDTASGEGEHGEQQRSDCPAGRHIARGVDRRAIEVVGHHYTKLLAAACGRICPFLARSAGAGCDAHHIAKMARRLRSLRYRLAMAEPEHARRSYCHRDTGEEVHLSAQQVIQHSGRAQVVAKEERIVELKALLAEARRPWWRRLIG